MVNIATLTRPHSNANGLNSAQKGALVRQAQCLIEPERHTLQHVAEGDAIDQRGHETAKKQGAVPDRAPRRRRDLATELEPNRAKDQRAQQQQHRQIEAGESDGI
jgi:hypothetical protein